MFGACSRDVTLRTQRGRARVRRRYAQALCVCAALPNVVVGSSIAQITARSFHSHSRARAGSGSVPQLSLPKSPGYVLWKVRNYTKKRAQEDSGTRVFFWVCYPLPCLLRTLWVACAAAQWRKQKKYAL
jgi:hypothetical protein